MTCYFNFPIKKDFFDRFHLELVFFNQLKKRNIRKNYSLIFFRIILFPESHLEVDRLPLNLI